MHEFNDVTRRLGAAGPSVCALVQDMLPFYLDGDLTKDSRAFIDDHLHTCERCASFLAGGRSVQEHLRRDPSLRQPRPIAYPVRTDAIVTQGRRRLFMYALFGLGIAMLLMACLGGIFVRDGAIAPAPEPAQAVNDEYMTVPEPIDSIGGIATPTPVPFGAMGGVATPTPWPTSTPNGQLELPPTPVPADIPPPAIP